MAWNVSSGLVRAVAKVQPAGSEIVPTDDDGRRPPGQFGMMSDLTSCFKADLTSCFKVGISCATIPDILSVLPLFAQLRTCILAVVFAAESATESADESTASVAVSRLNDEWFAILVFMKTTTPAGSETADVPLHSTMEFGLSMAAGDFEAWYERDSHD